MNLNFWSNDPVKKRLKAVQAEIDSIKAKQDLEHLEADLAHYRHKEKYSKADPASRMRLDAEREVMLEAARTRALQKQRDKDLRKKIKIAPEALQLLSAAKESIGEGSSVEAIAVRAQESILQAVNGTPYGFDLIAEYRQLLQVPTLIRELWPYKPTIIRTQPMLDFVRWICRVVYEECPVFKGIVKGKVNYICRGMQAKVAHKNKADSDELVDKAQKYLDMFVEQQDYLNKRKERRRRMMIEGEAFFWIEDGKDLENKAPTGSFIEPDFIRPSQKRSTNQEDPHMSGDTTQEDWSFGIHTPKHQYWKPLAYQVVWNTNDEEIIEAEDMLHTAIRERSNIKRCLPPAFCLVDDMIRLTLLRAALADASKFRASIGGVVKYEQASVQSVRSLSEAISGSCYPNLDSSIPEVQTITSDNFTNLISLPSGRDFVKGPDFPDTASLESIYMWHIRAIAQAEQLPEWMVSGEAAASSYASANTSESSSIIEFEAEQEQECEYDRIILKRVLSAYVKAKLLPEDFFDNYTLVVEGESMVVRDEKAETETAVMCITNHLMSVSTAQTKLGLDPKKEQALIEQEQAAGIGPPKDARPEDTPRTEMEGTNVQRDQVNNTDKSPA